MLTILKWILILGTLYFVGGILLVAFIMGAV